jgi:hypothetical protein
MKDRKVLIATSLLKAGEIFTADACAVVKVFSRIYWFSVSYEVFHP